jgi:hypothetical protein
LCEKFAFISRKIGWWGATLKIEDKILVDDRVECLEVSISREDGGQDVPCWEDVSLVFTQPLQV